MTDQTRLPIPEISDVEAAFPARPPLPKWEDLPKEFRKNWHRDEGFCGIASSLFYRGGALSDYKLKPKDGIDVSAARRAIQTCLGSFEPKHEHKIAGVGYMLSEWFEIET